MAEYFAGGRLRFVDGEWRNDNGDIIEISRVRYGEWETNSDMPDTLICSVCKCGFDMWKHDPHNFCPNCGAKMDVDVEQKEGADND